MPLQISISLSKKLSENFNSEGCSVSLSAELDQTLLTRPDELQQAIAELNEQAELALDRKMNGEQSPSPTIRDRARFDDNRSSGAGGNGQPNNRSQSGRSATQAQLKAINAIADQIGIDASAEARHEFGAELTDLSIRDASKLIDLLKSRQTAPANRSRS